MRLRLIESDWFDVITDGRQVTPHDPGTQRHALAARGYRLVRSGRVEGRVVSVWERRGKGARR